MSLLTKDNKDMYVDFKRAYASRAKKEFDNGVKFIKPTVFNKDYSVNKITTSSFIDDINTEVVFTKDKADTNQFVKVHPLLISNLIGTGESVFAVLGYFIQNIRYNSNCLHCTIDLIAQTTAISTRSVKDAIDYLCTKQIIAKTTIQSEYIINHNLIFKGSIDNFIKAYNKLYEGKYAKRDSKGKVILSKDIVNIERDNRRKGNKDFDEDEDESVIEKEVEGIVVY